MTTEEQVEEFIKAHVIYQITGAGGGMVISPETLRAVVAKALRADVSREAIAVPVATLERWKENVSHYWFGSDGEDEYNNDEIIETDKEITALLEAHEKAERALKKRSRDNS